MVEALQKLPNKLSHRSWQFRWPKWVFRHLLHDWLSAWQTKMHTGSLSVCLSLFFFFLSQATDLCHECHSWGNFCFVLFFLNVFWGLFDVDSLLFFCVLVVCGADLLIWRWGSWFAGEHLHPQQEVRTGSCWWNFASNCRGRGGILHFAPFSYGQQCFGMGWDFTVEQNKVPSPLRDRSFCPQSPSSCDQKDKVCCAQDLVGHGASTYGCKGTVAAKAVALKTWCRQTACLNPRSLGSSTVARSVLPSRELACCPPFRLGL